MKLDRIFSSFGVQKSSDPGKKIDPFREIRVFKTTFSLFNSFVFAVSLAIILSYLRDRSLDLPKSCPNEDKNLRNLYDLEFSFDLHVFLSESEENLNPESRLIWSKQNLIYGDVQSSFSFSTNISVSEVGK